MSGFTRALREVLGHAKLVPRGTLFALVFLFTRLSSPLFPITTESKSEHACPPVFDAKHHVRVLLLGPQAGDFLFKQMMDLTLREDKDIIENIYPQYQRGFMNARYDQQVGKIEHLPRQVF